MLKYHAIGSADEFSTSTSLPSILTRFVRLALLRIGARVRSLSARSFKVRHGMHIWEGLEPREGGVPMPILWLAKSF